MATPDAWNDGQCDLSTTFAGVKFPNPLIAGSADFSRSIKQIDRLLRTGVGGVVFKSVTDAEALQGSNLSRFLYLDSGRAPVQNASLWPIPENFSFFSRGGPMLSVRAWKEIGAELVHRTKEAGVVPIGSVSATTADKWVELSGAVEDSGVDLLELNLGNPHAAASSLPLGADLGRDYQAVARVVDAVKKAVRVPVVAKLTPQVGDIVESARAALDAGADGVTLVHRFQGLVVDVETGLPSLGSYAAIGGAWMVPVALAYVAKVRTALGAEICGSGGVSTANDVIQFLLAGAQTVQVTSALMLSGGRAAAQILDGLKSYTARKNIAHLRDLVGASCKAIIPYGRIGDIPRVRAVLDPSVCSACSGRPCLEVCYFDALQSHPAGVSVGEACCGCGLCKQYCPKPGGVRIESVMVTSTPDA